MQPYLRHIALLLLLLFCRAMVPDAYLLELHPHTHTVHTDHTDKHKAQVGLKHKHCPVGDVFGEPFQGSLPPLEIKPIVHTTAYAAHYSGAWQSSPSYAHYLRGPPVAS